MNESERHAMERDDDGSPLPGTSAYNALNSIQLPERDPRIDPQPGDMIRKVMPSGKAADRFVTGRKGNEIYYATRQVRVPIKNCWITTWQTWAVGTVVGARA